MWCAFELLSGVDLARVIHASPVIRLARSHSRRKALQSLIGNIGSFLNTKVKHGKSKQQAHNEQNPGRDEDVHEPAQMISFGYSDDQ